jgi:hypothetical protein
MPTPFTHLRLLTDLLGQVDTWLPSAVARRLGAGRGPFLLGGTAPDVRKISPVSREETHFYPIPPDPSRPSMQTMLRAWPELADPATLESDHALFIAGYLAHLWFDEFWHRRIVYPYYVQRDDWGTHRGRFDIYNVLIGYLDIQDRHYLGDGLGNLLQEVEPDRWLPFVSDSDLIGWRNFLADQLHHGALTKTAEILARRARMSQSDYLALISDEERIEHEVFIRTPREAIDKVYLEGLSGSAQTILAYLT